MMYSPHNQEHSTLLSCYKWLLVSMALGQVGTIAGKVGKAFAATTGPAKLIDYLSRLDKTPRIIASSGNNRSSMGIIDLSTSPQV